MGGTKLSGWLLAVDFGTSFTSAAVVVPGSGGRAELVEVDRSRFVPSVVYRDEAGGLLAGRDAVGKAVVFPERVPKRALAGAADRVVLGGAAVPVTEVAGAVLGRVYAEAVRRRGVTGRRGRSCPGAVMSGRGGSGRCCGPM